MEKILESHDRPVPTEFKVAAAVASLGLLLVFVSTPWVIPLAAGLATALLPSMLGLASSLLYLLVMVAGAVAMVVLVWLAFRWPVLAIGLALLPLALGLVLGTDSGAFPVAATLAGIAVTSSWRRPREAIAAAVLAVTVMWVPVLAFWPGVWRDGNYEGLPLFLPVGVMAAIGTVLVVVATVGALALRVWVLREVERKELAARAGQVEEQSAVVEERARLARDLHDVVAHHVSLIAVRAETAPYTHPTLDAQARTVLTDIAADARLALDELRGVLGILGRAGEDAQRAPQPSWADISALVERTRAAGLQVTLEGDIAAAVSPGVGYAAYRVVQEGLTNARKHAPGAPVRVGLSATDRLVHVSVRNPASAGPAAAGGRGLVGMRERVSALGGRMTAGPVGEEHVVEVTLPVVGA